MLGRKCRGVFADDCPLSEIMSETLSVSQRTIERDLSAMKEMGILKREGKDNDGIWAILS